MLENGTLTVMQGRMEGVIMGAEGKVFTVSYGLFSCTLTGFDDPFDVMRAVTLLIEDIVARNP